MRVSEEYSYGWPKWVSRGKSAWDASVYFGIGVICTDLNALFLHKPSHICRGIHHFRLPGIRGPGCCIDHLHPQLLVDGDIVILTHILSTRKNIRIITQDYDHGIMFLLACSTAKQDNYYFMNILQITRSGIFCFLHRL